ncbi:hypothetical protein OCHUTO_1029 [Orientia chuto str. Dubai]|uniref:Uncharacterized protein n=1 Tax=Orientia chuto str. Dubai TaxID=1359168 RepID=A0A0F3MGN2_9RICK|nr:hypothetical protein OCHUTO_1029 [Orientia chuto str. Dubai]
MFHFVFIVTFWQRVEYVLLCYNLKVTTFITILASTIIFGVITNFITLGITVAIFLFR